MGVLRFGLFMIQTAVFMICFTDGVCKLTPQVNVSFLLQFSYDVCIYLFQPAIELTDCNPLLLQYTVE
jgi:hypothetical protein